MKFQMLKKTTLQYTQQDTWQPHHCFLVMLIQHFCISLLQFNCRFTQFPIISDAEQLHIVELPLKCLLRLQLSHDGSCKCSPPTKSFTLIQSNVECFGKAAVCIRRYIEICSSLLNLLNWSSEKSNFSYKASYSV